MIRHKKDMKEGFRTLDLFAGVGGIRLGFEKAGFKTIFANDFDKTCKETYDLNFSEPKLNTEDITKLNINSLPELVIWLGGFPGRLLGFPDIDKDLKMKKIEE